ncbi:MAG: hypothetical protein M3P85_08360 [Actinomycetota bacterium]|nr:hypothetical protein [Actinomycetota bacterium]
MVFSAGPRSGALPALQEWLVVAATAAGSGALRPPREWLVVAATTAGLVAPALPAPLRWWGSRRPCTTKRSGALRGARERRG